MVYICAWQAAPLQPAAWISSMIAAAARMVSPEPPYSIRDQRGQKPGLGQRGDEFGRIGALAVERAPIFTGETRSRARARIRGWA